MLLKDLINAISINMRIKVRIINNADSRITIYKNSAILIIVIILNKEFIEIKFFISLQV